METHIRTDVSQPSSRIVRLLKVPLWLRSSGARQLCHALPQPVRLQLEEVLVHVAEDADGRAARGHEWINLRRQQDGPGFGQLALSGGCFQSQSMPQNNPSSGQPRLIRRLGHADRPHRPWFRPRERPRGPGTRAARAQWCRSRRVGRAASKARTPPRRTRPRTL